MPIPAMFPRPAASERHRHSTAERVTWLAALIAAAFLYGQAAAPAAASVRARTLATAVPASIVRGQVEAGRRLQSWVDARSQSELAAGKIPLVFVTDSSKGAVFGYQTNAATLPTAPLETIGGLSFPNGVAVDASGNLYVVEGGANDIKVFAPGSTTPFKTLLSPLGVSFIAVNASGTVSVISNSPGLSLVSVYAKGATSPTVTLSAPPISFLDSVAIDNTGNIFVTYQEPNSLEHVGAFAASTSLGLGWVFTTLKVDSPTSTHPVTQAQHLAIDKFGDLIVNDNTFGSNLYAGVYQPAGQTAAFVLQAPIFGSEATFALSGPDDHHIFVSTQLDGNVYEYAYPSMKLQQKIPTASGLIASIAVYPASNLGTW